MPRSSAPHFSLPFQFANGVNPALCHDQDTDEEIMDCVRMILMFPVGSREDLPSFGCPELLFRQLTNEASLGRLHAAVVNWEPRVDIDVHLRAVLADPYVQQYIMRVKGSLAQ